MPGVGRDLTDRQKLACSLRHLDDLGFCENLTGHITWQRAGDETLLVNPWGLWWAETKASDILTITDTGEVVDGKWDVTPRRSQRVHQRAAVGDQYEPARVLVEATDGCRTRAARHPLPRQQVEDARALTIRVRAHVAHRFVQRDQEAERRIERRAVERHGHRIDRLGGVGHDIAVDGDPAALRDPLRLLARAVAEVAQQPIDPHPRHQCPLPKPVLVVFYTCRHVSNTTRTGEEREKGARLH